MRCAHGRYGCKSCAGSSSRTGIVVFQKGRRRTDSGQGGRSPGVFGRRLRSWVPERLSQARNLCGSYSRLGFRHERASSRGMSAKPHRRFSRLSDSSIHETALRAPSAKAIIIAVSTAIPPWNGCIRDAQTQNAIMSTPADGNRLPRLQPKRVSLLRASLQSWSNCAVWSMRSW